MSTFAIVVILLAVAGGVAYLIKSGKVKDENNNFIPDVIENKVAEVKEVVKKSASKAKAVKADVEKVAKKVEAVKKAAPKKAATKSTKK